MPRVYAPRRPHVGYREDTATLVALDRLAAAHGVDRSDILRAATNAYLDAHQSCGGCQAWSHEYVRRSCVELIAEPHVDAP